MSLYQELIQNPPKISIKKDAKEVHFTTISCMCDNQHTISFKKNDNGEFTISGRGHALSNWQMKHDTIDLCWAADEGHWDNVIQMINTGTSIVEKARQR